MVKRPLPPASMCGPDFPPPCQAVPSCPTPAQRGWKVEAFQAAMAVSRTGHPPPWGPPLPILGHLTSALLTPKLRKGELSPWVSRGFCRVQAQLPTTPSGTQEQPPPRDYAHPSCTSVGKLPALQGGVGANGHTGGMERASHRLMPPQHSQALGTSPHPYGIRWDPDFSHSSRLSPQRAGWPLATS